MRPLEHLIRDQKQIRVIGFDDAPFEQQRGSPVNIAGIVCSQTRFEGMLWGEASKDGNDATECLAQLLLQSKFHQQIHVVLLDGIAIGGFNVIDLPKLSQTLDRPCIAVMRKMPNLTKIDQALRQLSDGEEKRQRLQKAGPIHQQQGFIFQVCGCSADTAAKVLQRLTDQGQVPEALRLAHLIGAAIITGQSSNRA